MMEIVTILHNRWRQTDREVGVTSFRCWIAFSLYSRLSYYVYILMEPDFRHCFLYGRAFDQDITGFTFRKWRNGWILRIFCQSYGSNFALHLRLQECVNAYELYSQAFSAYVYWTVHHLTSWINWTNLMSLYEVFYCSTCFESYYIHPQGTVTVCVCIALFRCVLVYWCRTAPIHQYTPKQSNTHTYNRQLLRMNVIAFETCWAIKNLHKVSSSWFNLFNKLLVLETCFSL